MGSRMKLDSAIGTTDSIIAGVPGRNSSLAVSESALTPILPPKVAHISKEVLKSFPHTKRVGNYLLGRTLGEGSFAKVKEGLHVITGEKVAVKVVDKKKAKEDAYVRKNMRREGKLLQTVRHQNILSLYEIMETENSYYLVTELCEGGDLMDHICAKRKLEEREVRRYVRQVVSAVDYLHKTGILHRDLKVENLLLDEKGDIKIIDFGLSNSIRACPPRDGSIMQEFCVTQCGSPAYAAPELLGNKPYGVKVDVWSIGINMYAMLTGNLPFTVEPFNIKTLHNKMVSGDMNAVPEHLTLHCKSLLRSFLTPDPDKRICLQDVMRHPWINEGKTKPMEPAPFPNKLGPDELDESIVNHMTESLDFRLSDVVRLVTSNVPSSAMATYHMFTRRLRKFNAEMRVKGKVAASDARILTTSNHSGQAAGDKVHILPVPDMMSKARSHCRSADKNKAAHPLTQSPSPHRTDLEVRLTRRRMRGSRRTNQRRVQSYMEPGKAAPDRQMKGLSQDQHHPCAENLEMNNDVFRTTQKNPTENVEERLFKITPSPGGKAWVSPRNPPNSQCPSIVVNATVPPSDVIPSREQNGVTHNDRDPTSQTDVKYETGCREQANAVNCRHIDYHKLDQNNSRQNNKLLKYRPEQVQGRCQSPLPEANWRPLPGNHPRSRSQCHLAALSSNKTIEEQRKISSPGEKKILSDLVNQKEVAPSIKGNPQTRPHLIEVNNYQKYSRKTSSQTDPLHNSVDSKCSGRNIHHITGSNTRNGRPALGIPGRTIRNVARTDKGHLNVTGESSKINQSLSPRTGALLKRSVCQPSHSVDKSDTSIMEITIDCKMEDSTEVKSRRATSEGSESVALPAISSPTTATKTSHRTDTS